MAGSIHQSCPNYSMQCHRSSSVARNDLSRQQTGLKVADPRRHLSESKSTFWSARTPTHDTFQPRRDTTLRCRSRGQKCREGEGPQDTTLTSPFFEPVCRLYALSVLAFLLDSTIMGIFWVLTEAPSFPLVSQTCSASTTIYYRLIELYRYMLEP